MKSIHTLFNKITNCSLCNTFSRCCKYKSEIVCEMCYSNLNKYKGNAESKLEQLREERERI